MAFCLPALRPPVVGILLGGALVSGCWRASPADDVQAWLRAHGGCESVTKEVTTTARGPLWMFTLERCDASDHAAASDRLVSGLRRDVPGFCDLDAEIALQFYEDGVYDPYVYRRCLIQFQF